jgi:hypothetical protein
MEDLSDVFDTKYEEFARDLQGACPELADKIAAALALSPDDRRDKFKEQVLSSCSPSRSSDAAPAYVMPGVPMPKETWEVLSSRSKKAIQEYMTILSFTYLMDSDAGKSFKTGGWSAEWATKMMDEMKAKMENVDFTGIAEKIAKLFATTEDGGFPNGIPQMPEKFLKGQIAKLAEEIVKEFRMEDFGVDPKVMAEAGNDPTKALNIIMEIFMKNPASLQNTMKKLGKKLQMKIQSGVLRPQELVAEAEELMKTFSENPQFVQMMEAFRRAFGFEDQQAARATGNDNDNRLSMVRNRLRAKLDAKRAAAAGKKQ